MGRLVWEEKPFLEAHEIIEYDSLSFYKHMTIFCAIHGTIGGVSAYKLA